MPASIVTCGAVTPSWPVTSLALFSAPRKCRVALPLFASIRSGALPPASAPASAKVRDSARPCAWPLPETVMALLAPVTTEAFMLARRNWPSVTVPFWSCACKAASQLGGVMAALPPGSGQGRSICGEMRVRLVACSLPCSKAGREMASVRERAWIVSWSGPVMVMRSAMSCGAGSKASDSLPLTRTVRPVSEEASASIVPRCVLEATKPGRARSAAPRRMTRPRGRSRDAFCSRRTETAIAPARRADGDNVVAIDPELPAHVTCLKTHLVDVRLSVLVQG